MARHGDRLAVAACSSSFCATDGASRRAPSSASSPAARIVASLVFTGPLVVWRMFTTLGPDERVMWLVWTWGLVIVARGLRRYRIRPSGTA